MACVIARPEGGRMARDLARTLLADPDLPGTDAAGVRAVLESQVQAVEDELSRLGWSFVAAGEPGFPERLSAMVDPPTGLFVRGTLPRGHAVAIVGARHASAYGREVAEYLARELAASGVTVVSGMARGVDAAAHRGALAAHGPTVAVWGSGPDRVYPSEHRALADEIAGCGCLTTEYPPGCAPLPHHFPERNRIIAGLSEVVVVVEADERSGALITARLALEEGREVMAVPGSVFSRLSAGPNGLLRAGATPVVTADDVLGVLGLPPRPAQAGNEEEPPLLALIRPGEAVTVDRLAAESRLPVARVLEVLLALELAGRVERQADGRYLRSHVSPGP